MRHRRGSLSVMRVLALILVAACSSKAAKKDNTAICEQAGERYATCIGEIVGPELEALARSKDKDGTAACTRDDKTVAMYRKCLPSASCREFMDCMDAYVRGAQPAIASGTRAEQCAQHVEQGLRGIANTTMIMSEHEQRSDAEKRRAQECLFDEARPWQDCITDAERAEVMAYAEQRRRDCEAWDDDLAACVLRQPGAKNCNKDEFPLWEAPVQAGAPGPEVAWTASLTDASDDGREAQFRLAAGLTLIVRDDRGLHALQGEGGAATERWSIGLANTAYQFELAGNHLVLRDTGPNRGLVVWEASTGKELGRALPGASIEHHGAVGDRVLVQTTDNELYEITPGRCRDSKKQTKGCATKLGTLDDDDALNTTSLGMWRDGIVMTSMSGIQVVDRRGKTRLALRYDDADTIVPAGDRVAVVTGSRVQIVALDGCTADADCVIARHPISWVMSVVPVALPGGAIAFNDHGLIEKTQLVDGTKTWAVKTNGRGRVAGDAHHVYTISFGRSRKQPTHLLALSRATGKVVWQTELPGAAHDATLAAIQVRDGVAAVRVGDKLYVIELGRTM